MDLTGLLSDAEYEVRIRAMNKQGWSQLSQPFFFKTLGIQGWCQLSQPFFFKTSGKQGWSQLSQPSLNLQVDKDRTNYPNLL